MTMREVLGVYLSIRKRTAGERAYRCGSGRSGFESTWEVPEWIKVE